MEFPPGDWGWWKVQWYLHYNFQSVLPAVSLKNPLISKSIIDITNLMQTGTTVYQASGEIVDICKYLKMVVFSKSESSPLHRRAERAKKKKCFIDYGVYINASILPCPH